MHDNDQAVTFQAANKGKKHVQVRFGMQRKKGNMGPGQHGTCKHDDV